MHNNFLKNNLISAGLIILLFFVLSKSVQASSELNFIGTGTETSVGGDVAVSLVLSTTEAVNAVDIEIHYPNDKLKYDSFSNAGSIVDFWRSKPTLIRDGVIKISGGIMSGYKGTSGQIIKINFSAISLGVGNISLGEKSLYLADGKATLIVPETSSYTIKVSETAEKAVVEPEEEIYKEDKTPPDILLTIVPSPESDEELIVFNATDKESGIKDTEMRYKRWWAFSDWVSVDNPAIYPKGSWVIELKATNNAGKESVDTLKLPGRFYFKIIALVLLLSLLVFMLVSLYNKIKRII
jgi:hypothetical protein